jgi:alpha-glucosidase
MTHTRLLAGVAALGVVMLVGRTAKADAPYDLRSPDSQIVVQVSAPSKGSADVPMWSATFHGKPILTGCRLSLAVRGEGDLLAGARLVRRNTRVNNRRIRVLFGKASVAQDNYREARFSFESLQKKRLDVVFRCYNDAIAFRYEVPAQERLDEVVITEEGSSFALAGNPTAYLQILENYRTSHEHNVTVLPLRQAKPDALLDTPATFKREDGIHLAITEASLRRYAGMALMRPAGGTENTLVCKLTPRPDGAKVIRATPMETPWRVVLAGDRAGVLLESNTLYCLNDPPAIGATSWIKPGKMSWAWWNGNVVENGEAKPPIFSMEAQKRYIDFCAANGIAYHSVIADNTDTPWYYQTQKGVAPGPDTDVLRVREDLDLAGIRKYAASKGVRLWTWVHQAALKGRVEEAFAAFERFGWSGMMVDFFDHDDQETVEFAEEILKAAARHRILIHFHGIWKPTGWNRAYPNLMNHEGALNFEYLKWSDQCTPEHTLNLLFTRMVAGPMDYHAGGFRAVKRGDFAIKYIAPNVFGTRCHQMASYVCFDNPNPMLADYPGAYEGQEGLEFLRSVPTWWDETRVLAGEAGRFIVTARRRGAKWYAGGMAAGKARDVEASLSFLGAGRYKVTLWRDSAATDDNPNRLQKESFFVQASDVLRVRVSEDGGFAAEFAPAP